MMRWPWSWGETDEVLPELHALRAQLDAALVDVQCYNARVQAVAAQPPPDPGTRPRREVPGE